jgi:hypothetical protein
VGGACNTNWEMRNLHLILFEKPDENTRHGRRSCTLETTIKLILGMECCDMDLIQVVSICRLLRAQP